jgi:hypothetical protein
MFTLTKEHRYLLYTKLDTLVLRIEEYISGVAPWPDKYRIQMPASSGRRAKTFYGSTSREVAELAAGFIESA